MTDAMKQPPPTEPTLTVANDPAFNRTMSEIHDLGMDSNLAELETYGFSTVRGVLDESLVERARTAICDAMTRKRGISVDFENESSDQWQGMSLAHYLLFEDEVFEEIAVQARPLALINYLLGRSALLSSMTCHFKARGGDPLGLHSDNGNGIPAPYSMISQVANVNYALTPYSEEEGALALVPGSHRLCRPPRIDETGLRGDSRNPNAIAMDLEPGDCVVWHGNTWHGSFVRQVPGIRINLAVYFCRQYVVTQERFGRDVPESVLERNANNGRFLTMLGQKQAYGWASEGPDWQKFGRMPRGQFD